MFSNDKNVETIGQLVEVLKHYIGLQSEYMKLDVVDKVVRLLTAITMTVVLLGLFLIAIIYLSFAAAYGLAGLTGSTALAFCVVAGVYLFILYTSDASHAHTRVCTISVLLLQRPIKAV